MFTITYVFNMLTEDEENSLTQRNMVCEVIRACHHKPHDPNVDEIGIDCALKHLKAQGVGFWIPESSLFERRENILHNPFNGEKVPFPKRGMVSRIELAYLCSVLGVKNYPLKAKIEDTFYLSRNP